MDRSNSLSSNASSASRSDSSAPFAYQTRLLERTTSRSGAHPLSRNNSQSSAQLLPNTTGSSVGSIAARRWTPAHRVTNSLDTMRGKWEERSRDAALSDASAASTSRTSPLLSTVAPNTAPPQEHSFRYQPSAGLTSFSANKETDATPKYLKRQTLPAPIIASPLSPNSTGISVEADYPLSATTHRIRIPVSDSPSTLKFGSDAQPGPSRGASTTHRLPTRSQTVDLTPSSFSPTKPKFDSSFSSRFEERKAAWARLEESQPSTESIHVPARRRPLSMNGLPADFKSTNTPPAVNSMTPVVNVTPSSPAPSVMHPTQYRSSYLTNKKVDSFDSLSAGGRRRLGNHLPRIASGDGDDSWPMDKPSKSSKTVEEHHASQTTLRRQGRAKMRDRRFAAEIQEKKLTPSGVLTGDGVVGLPGRIQLKAPSSAAPSSTSVSRLFGGSWADKQRHLLQAYEYLCHIGEAQQWIEGCLGEELDCGVVELEDALQNGVILAKLVRAFQGESVVKRIFEGVTKRDFRYSENINYFFRFVDEVGLPKGFHFELTDLYEKKNLPKVIYCIHALSHLLAHRGLAQRIGNLLGQLHFSDDQLLQTQKGLTDAGVSMPNFGNVGRDLAKEINEEPVQETDDEHRDRLLLERQDSIIALQTQARGFLVRRAVAVLKGRTRLADRHIVKFQTFARGVLSRRQIALERQSRSSLLPWVIIFQARVRGLLVRRRWVAQMRSLRRSVAYIVKVQAQIRGALERRRFQRLVTALRKIGIPTKRLQAAARGNILRRQQREITKSFFKTQVSVAIVAIQAHCRGALARRNIRKRARSLRRVETDLIKLQAHCRGLLTRRKLRTQQNKLRNNADTIVGIQAAVRTYLARKRLLLLIRGLRRASSVIVGFQTRARANIVRQKHQAVTKALMEPRMVRSVQGIQSLVRGAIVRNRQKHLVNRLEINVHDIIGTQSVARGVLVRQDFRAWKHHLHRSQDAATFLQSLLRGVAQRRTFKAKMDYYRANLSKVVKIQSLFRAKETREQYRQLTLGKNVTVGTIKNFVHLLDDSEADFQEEIKVEKLRKRVVESIRENQSLENDINDLEMRIQRIVENVRSVEDVVKARTRRGDIHALDNARKLLAAHKDPFSASNALDHEARRKLELYQQLFYHIQTHPQYLTSVLSRLSQDDRLDSQHRFMERATLTLFGYGQDRREEFLLLKLFQSAIHHEVSSVDTVDAILGGQPLHLSIAVQYVRPKQASYARDSLHRIIGEVFDVDDLDLECDPSIIHRARIEMEEMKSGKSLPIAKDLSFRDAARDPETRAIYIRHLQILQAWVEAFISAITQSTKRMPFSMRYLARETLIALRGKFPDVSDEVLGACIGRMVFHHYVNPALIAPESFGIIPKSKSLTTGKQNLAQISKVLAQITSGVEFDDEYPSYVPINDFVRKAIKQMSAWYIEVADVPDAETHFHAHEFMDATVQPKPIYISPNEVYQIHQLLIQHQSAWELNDPLRTILTELGGIPQPDIGIDKEALKDARDAQITLELTNRFAQVEDPHASEKKLWVQAKRGVLAILRVQPAADLLESLMRPVTDNDEMLWDEILDAEIENEMRKMPRRQPSTVPMDSAYDLADIRKLNFAAVKAIAISDLLELESIGKITRRDGFQGILNAIAGDVRSKHRKRLQRQQEMESMNDALRQLGDRKRLLNEKFGSYSAVVETAMTTMQSKGGKKRSFVLPFTKQAKHQRDLEKAGEAPQFGSFIYSAKELYDRHILLSIEGYSPRQFEKLHVTLSSNVAGVLKIVLESNVLGVSSRVASQEVSMEDLLQTKYQRNPSLSLLDGKMKVNFESFLYQVNKKFYS